MSGLAQDYAPRDIEVDRVSESMGQPAVGHIDERNFSPRTDQTKSAIITEVTEERQEENDEIADNYD